MKSNIFFLSLCLLLFSCNDADKKTGNSHDVMKPERPSLGNHKSVGSLSFKLNGEFFEADPSRAKAWTSNGIPLAMLVAKNDKGLSVSAQIKNFNNEGTYKLDSDSKGGASFTVNGKTYGTLSVMKDDCLNVVITGIKTLGPVLLLSGTFEGVLEDKDRNKVQITEGRFTTKSL